MADTTEPPDDPEPSPANITRDVHHRFCHLPAEIKKRQQREQEEKRKRYNRFMRGYMTQKYWKTHKRLTVPLSLPQWERLTRFAQKHGHPRTTVLRQAALDRIDELDPPGEPRNAFRARTSASRASSQDPVLQQDLALRKALLQRADRVDQAIERVGININQTIRHIHTQKDAAFREIRACHDLLKGLKHEVRRALTG